MKLTGNFFIAACLLVSSASYSGVGKGFGESIRMNASARQAGTGGLPLEDLASRIISMEAHQVYLGMGVRWLGLGLEGNILPNTRVGLGGTGVFADRIPETTENPDGSFAEQVGMTQAAEYEWNAYVQQSWDEPKSGNRLNIRLVAHALSQDLSGDRAAGAAASAIGFGQIPLSPGEKGPRALYWASAGPLGNARSRSFSRSVRVGVGLEVPGGMGILSGKEGARIGVEGENLLEGLWQAGVGALYWLGGREQEGPGFRLILRAGARGMQEGIVGSQVRFGLGLMMGSEGNYGWSVDYSMVPFGAFGNLHYMSARIVLGSLFLGRRHDFPQDLERL